MEHGETALVHTGRGDPASSRRELHEVIPGTSVRPQFRLIAERDTVNRRQRGRNECQNGEPPLV